MNRSRTRENTKEQRMLGDGKLATVGTTVLAPWDREMYKAVVASFPLNIGQ